MSRIRLMLFFALALLGFDLVAASPAAAQLRRRDRDVQRVHRSDDRSRDSRVERRGQSNEDSDEDSDDDSDDGDRGRGRGHHGRRSGRDACVDVDRDGRCDFSPAGRFPDGRSSTDRIPDRSRSRGCVDRDRDGRCDSRAGIPGRLPLPLSQLLGAVLAGR